VLVSAVDLLAALPSVIYGMFGLFVLLGPLQGYSQWLANHLSAIPLLRADRGVTLTRSIFDCGVIVGIMIIPIITSVTRDVMAQCPREQCEGALALGGSRWGMVRAVILPFSRSGTVGAALLGFGRALGETIAIAIIISYAPAPNTRILTQGGGSIAALISIKFGEAHAIETKGLIAAGLVLFIVTLFVNLVARRIVARARSAT
jgi:phosphate transport system permease protein